MRDPVFWGLIVLATLLLLGSSWIAWKQEPHPDAYRAAPDWFSKDFWLYPIEVNAFKRLPSIRSDLRAIHVHADGQRIWAAGDKGTIVHSEDGGKSWQKQTSGTFVWLHSITFVSDGQRGWATGQNGTILHTMNGGKSWQQQASGTREALWSITFTIDGQRGWAAGVGGTILHTADGGKSWQGQISGTKEQLTSIVFAEDGQRGLVVGDGGAILYTEDGGKSWQRQVSGTKEQLTSIVFLKDSQRGWAVGASGTIVYTANGGRSWQKQVSGTKEQLNSIVFAENGQSGWAVGARGMILHTGDGGKTWHSLNSETKEMLTGIAILGDGQHGWVVGEWSKILYTEDGGKSWQGQVSGTREWLTSITMLGDGQRGWVVGGGGTILNTEDGGKSWQGQISGTREILTGITILEDGQRGWVVGGGGAILHTEDGGRSWQVQSWINTGNRSIANITFLGDGQRGWAVGGNFSLLLHTEDGGKSWLEQSFGGVFSYQMLSITFLENGQRGWAVGLSNYDGSGIILYTEDGGKNWRPQIQGVKLLKEITFLKDGQRGWAVGQGGTILQTMNGGKSWQGQVSGTDTFLTSITFATDGQRGWVVGPDGMILHTMDGGKSWQEQVSGTKEHLKSIVFSEDGQRGWAVGSGRTILHTENGGKSWHAVTYRMCPARWFYLILVAVSIVYITALWWRARQIRQAGRQTPVRSVSDHAATDRPVSLGDPDFLGARRIATGLMRFLTNAKTEPPLTLAITGDWGSGKSSLMNYLFANLKRQGLRPVWFNAWHHREEQNVLASILAKVQQQAIKPWWHPAGFWFRGRLWWRRHLLWKALMLITLFCFFFAMTWLILLPKEKWHDTLQYARYWLKVDQPVVLSIRGFETLCPGWIDSPQPVNDAVVSAAPGLVPAPGKEPQQTSASQDIGESQPVRVSSHFDTAQCKVLRDFSVQQRKIDALHCIADVVNGARQACFATPVLLLDNIERQWQGMLLSRDEKLIREAMEDLQPDLPVPLPGELAGWIAAAFAALLFIAGKSMALLGLTSMQFFQTVVTRLRGVQQPAEKVGTRLLFEKYFKDITKLLGKRRLVLFIDDLDRCDREYTRQVLEVSNFLSSSGELFIVIGMAPRYVLANVMLSFQETAKAVHEADMRNGKTPPGHDPSAGQSWFAQHYLQKLINIEVPVPKPDAGQVRALLKNEVQSQEQDEDRKLEQLEKSEKRIDDALQFVRKTLDVVILLSVIAGAIYLAVWGLADKPVTSSVKELVQSPAPISPKATDKAGQAQNLPKEKSPDIKDETGGTEREIFIPAPSRDESFVTWPLWAGISTVVFVVLLSAVAYLLICEQDALNDQRWWWLKPLLKRLKVALFGPEVTQDTKDFTDALDIWYELIARKDPTPRNIKAFKNHLRYLASRDNQAPENSREAHLVALATLFYVYPKNFDEIPEVMKFVFTGSSSTDSLPRLESWGEAIRVMRKHYKEFDEIPSQEDIQFFKSMIQDMQIHRPSES